MGQTRGRKLLAELERRGWGEMTQPGEYPPRRLPWAMDNGAFGAWKAGLPFDAPAFRAALYRATLFTPPEFVVCPDLVAGGVESLRFSMDWRPEMPREWRSFLAVQDGMEDEHVEPVLRHFAGVFVGGTLRWKVRTGAAWVRLAHKHGRPCHVGRVGTGRRVRWARRIGADSIDSCLPLFAARNMDRFVRALEDGQGELWEAG